MFDAPSCHLQREKQNSGTGTKYFGGAANFVNNNNSVLFEYIGFFFSETISFEQKVNRSIVIIQSLRAKKSCCCARCVEQKSERVEWGPYVLSFGGS